MTHDDLNKLEIPDTPGVYIFRDQKKNPLYIGKATSLRNRVRSYFTDDLIVKRGPLLVDAITKSTTLTWHETDSVLEALILESHLIKKHQPYYNTKEKDDRTYYFVVITKEDFPRIFIERGSVLKNRDKLPYSIAQTYGPYPHGSHIKEALRIIRTIFPFRDKKAPHKHHERFYAQLGLMPDITSATAQKEYASVIRHIRLFFEGKKKTILTELEKNMKQCAKREDFEQAQIFKRRIDALRHINDVSLIKKDFSDASDSGTRVEAYDIAHMQGSSMVGVMTVIQGNSPDPSQYRKFHIRSTQTSDDTKALREVLERRLGHTEWPQANLWVIDGGVAQLNTALGVLENHQLENQIFVVSVVKDEKHKPRDILGKKSVIKNFSTEVILLANSEAHRFAISFFRKEQRRGFLG